MKTKPAKRPTVKKPAKPRAKSAVKATPAAREPRSPRPQSRFDAAATTIENANHFANSDYLGPNTATSEDIRLKIASRVRGERDNNASVSALVEGRAADTIGTGPRAQWMMPATWLDADFETELTLPTGIERQIALRFSDWADAINLPGKLTLLDETETTEGEAFGLAVTNPAVAESQDGMSLDLAIYSGSRCCNPDLDTSDPYRLQGIDFDKYSNPIRYWFLRQAPNENTWTFDIEADPYPASRVFHFYKPRSPGAARGVSPMAAAVMMCAVLRRYIGATLSAAEAQSMITAVLKTQANPDPSSNAPEIDAMDTIPFAKAMLLTLHAGQDVTTLNPSQPTQNFGEFVGALQTLFGRTIMAPRHISTGSAAEYNYSSARLDSQGYHRGIGIRRDSIRRVLLDRIMRLWITEAILIPGYLPVRNAALDLPPAKLWRWKWRWDGFASIDPLKDANAARVRMESGLTTMERELGEGGEDWEEVIEQKGRERKKCIAEGLPDPYPVAKSPTTPAKPNEQPSLFPEDEEEPANAA